MSVTSHRRDYLWVLVWVALSLGFGLAVLASQGPEAATEYYAAYFLEKALSVDNIFVFIIIFSELHIPIRSQRRVLLAGVAGALVLRALLIGAGITLIQRFEWVTYPFAGFILFAAWRMLFGEAREQQIVQEACDVCGTWIARVLPVTPVLHGGSFWWRERGRLVATPLFVALVLIETTDIVFALDSVPAVLSVTRSPAIVYTSNIGAMLGLRSLYFVVSDVLPRLRYLRPGLAVLLVFTAVKMLLSVWIHIGAGASVTVIATVLVVTFGASLLRPREVAHS